MPENGNTVAVLVAKITTSVEQMLLANASATHRDPMEGIHAMVAVIKRFDGEVTGIAGDGVLARFASEEDALDAAALVVQLAHAQGATVTAGICSGESDIERIVAGAGAMLKLATMGQIVACETTVDVLTRVQYPAGVVAVSTGRNGATPGFVVTPHAERIARLLSDYEGAPDVETDNRRDKDAWVVIEYGGSRRVIRERDAPVVLGRSPRCHILIKDNFVSRRHCTVRVEGGRALIEDTSSGGTWVWQPRREAVMVRQREVRLPEGGVLFLGYRPTRDRQPERVSFLVGADTRSAHPDTVPSNRYHRQLLRARGDERMALRDFTASMRLPDGATQLPVDVVDLGTGGVGLLADCPLGTVSDVMRLVLDKGGATIRCEIRHVGRRRSGRTVERWLHGAAFLDVDEEARSAVLAQVQKNANV